MSTVGQTAFRIPQLSNDDLSRFFESHLSDDAVRAFDLSFIKPCDDDLHHALSESSRNYALGGLGWEEDAYEQEDGLGYYPDGVKRTLTDEQIEIFRHSELHALQRKKEKEEERKAAKASTPSADTNSNIGEGSATDAAGVEEGEVKGDGRNQALANKKKRKRKGKGKNGKQPREPKPDLRKRTWDVVETGLDSLDYD